MKQKKNATNVASENQKAELRTAFAMPQFIEVTERLQNVVSGVEELMSRYEKNDNRYLELIAISNMITIDIYDKLAKIVGNDFMECTLNVLAK